MRMSTRGLAVLSGLLAVACGAPRTWAIQQASFDHRCDEKEVKVLRVSDNTKSLELDVCGEKRRYQYFSGGGQTWVDVTTPPSAKASEPTPPTR